MVVMRSALLALASAVVVSADYWVDPTSVPLSQRMAWCNDQRSSCPTICLQTSTGPPLVNTCDPVELNYGCLCSDNKQPNMTEFTLTLPYHVCTAWGTQCVAGCGSNNQCAASCREDHPCGAQSPIRVNATSSSTSTSAAPTSTATDGASFDGFADGSSNDNGKGKNAGATTFGSASSVGVVAAGLFAGFALLL
ncbi:hypothetical protein QBC42DRAFT_268693 [Cladorrhinum samala]|uniref:DUF7707 domain-containing protein n=1 Tax=Cladorrhinum samala TaxID=585594 RepID=A0AAV9HSX6_9PEZI|nr:hypothetical protein QBC42DRAFT_268693 [Cladorrhinum samala]